VLHEFDPMMNIKRARGWIIFWIPVFATEPEKLREKTGDRS
jgi:hypothetical protein